MPAKMSRSAPRPAFRLREVSIAVRTLRLSCRKAEKHQYSRQIGSHPGNSGQYSSRKAEPVTSDTALILA